MAGLDLTALDKVLKEIYVPAVREQMQKATILLAQVQKSSEYVDGTGKYAIVPLMLGYSEGIGARDEGDDLPDPSSTRYNKIQIPVKTTYGVIYVTGNAIRQTAKDSGAFVRAMDSEMKNMVEGFKRDINRQLFGDGTGKLTTVNGGQVGVNTIVVNSVLNMKIGMKIDIQEGVPITGRTVTAVDKTAVTITIDGAVVTVTNATVITRASALNKEMYGLSNIVASSNWLLNPASVPEWVANEATLPGSYTYEDILAKLQEAYSACEKYASVPPNFAVTTFEIRDQYATSLTTLRRMVNTIEVKQGFKGIAFNDLAIVPDDQCPTGVLYMLNSSHLLLATASDFDWADEDGKILDKVPNKDAYRAYMLFSGQFATDRRNAHAKVLGW